VEFDDDFLPDNRKVAIFEPEWARPGFNRPI
jgi:hypothetical protein